MLVWKFSKSGQILLVLEKFPLAVEVQKFFLEFEFLYVVVLIVTYVSKGRVLMRSTGSVEQPIELLSGLTY